MNKIILSALLVLLSSFIFSQAAAPIYSVCSLPSVINESSGIEKTGPNTFWSHNDSGGQPAIYKFDSSGVLLKTLTITNATNIDWEDIAQDQTLKTMYVGDFGNNNNNRSVANSNGLKIYRVSDPDLIAGNTTTAGIINFEYADRNFSAPATNHNFDMEGFFFFNDSLHLFTKNRTSPTNGLIKHYILPSTPGTYTAMVVDSFNNAGVRITGADISPNKKTVTLVANDKIWLFSCFKGSKFISTGTSTVLTMALTQKEAIVFSGDSVVYVTDEDTGGGTRRLYRANLAASLTPSIILNVTTSTPLLCSGQTATINVSGANTYTWSTSVTGQSITVSPTVTTTYSVTGTATTGCKNTISYTQNVSICTGFSSSAKQVDEMINLFPNPFSDKVTLTINEANFSFIHIYNSLGSLIYSAQIKQENVELDLKDQPKGIYFVKLRGVKGSITKKLIKE
jgi:hypothetical protein